MGRDTFVLAIALLANLVAVPASAQSLEITNIKGDLYQARSGSEVTVFLVTAAGIIMADPLDRDAARVLHKELAARFPDRPVNLRPQVLRGVGAHSL